MHTKSSQKFNPLSSQMRFSQSCLEEDFDAWALEVRRQMIASLKKRTVVYGDFWSRGSTKSAAKANLPPKP
jgi:hypothetical protein